VPFPQQEGDARLSALVRFLLLAHHAAKGGSLFALEQVIAGGVEAFACGYSLDDIKVSWLRSLSLARASAQCTGIMYYTLIQALSDSTIKNRRSQRNVRVPYIFVFNCGARLCYVLATTTRPR
jgi:hypothetical protein